MLQILFIELEYTENVRYKINKYKEIKHTVDITCRHESLRQKLTQNQTWYLMIFSPKDWYFRLRFNFVTCIVATEGHVCNYWEMETTVGRVKGHTVSEMCFEMFPWSQRQDWSTFHCRHLKPENILIAPLAVSAAHSKNPESSSTLQAAD